MKDNSILQIISFIKNDIMIVGDTIHSFLGTLSNRFDLFNNPKGYQIFIPFKPFKQILKSLFFPDNLRRRKGQLNEDLDNKLMNLEDRLILFKEIFELNSSITVGVIISPFSRSFFSISISELFYRFFYKVFCEFIQGKENIVNIVKNILEEWKDTLSKNKVKAIFELKLTRKEIECDLNSDNRFQILKKYFTVIDKDFTEILSSYDIFLLYKTELSIYFSNRSFRIEKGLPDDFNFFEEYKKRYLEFRAFLSALYLNNIEVRKSEPVIKLPWWIKPNEHRERELESNNKYKKITKEDYEDTLKTYNKLTNKEFFSNNCFPLYDSFLEFSLEHKNIIESIFRAHIILEYLFIPGSEGELSFRMALNASLFLSKSIDEFKENFYFFRFIYDIRSNAIHGGNWVKQIENKIRQLKKLGFFFDNTKDIMEHLRELIKKVIHNILNQDATVLQFKEEMLKNPFYFFENFVSDIIFKE